MATFTSTTNMKLMLGIPSEITDHDSVLDIIADAVDSIVLGEIGLTTSVVTSYTEKINIEDAIQNEFAVTNIPLVSITSLKVNTVLQSGATGYDFTEWGVVRMLPIYNFLPTGRNVIEITYTAGFASPPNDLKYAGSLIGCSMFNQQSHVGMKSEKVGEYQYTLGGNGGGSTIPALATRIFGKYRRIFARP
jgi:hypothetical protein